MCTAETYDDIHAKNHEERTNQSLKDDYAESQLLEVKVIDISNRKIIYGKPPRTTRISGHRS